MGREVGLIGATAEGEWALARLVDRYTDFRGTAARARSNGRRSLSPRNDTANLNALVDFVAIAESFSVSRLLAIAPSLSDAAINTWHKREKEWLREGSTDVAQFQHWLALLGFVDARNAIQHGLGRLTAMQLGKFKDQVIRQLSAAQVHRDGDQLVIRPADVDRCFNVCRDFIAWLDSEAPAPPTRR